MKIGSGAWMRESAFERWLAEVEADSPDGSEIVKTRYGCEVWNNGELVAEHDYDDGADNG